LAAYSGLFILSNHVVPFFKKNSSGLSSNSTAEQVLGNIDLKGKVIIVTGSNTGIGKETARVLAASGAHVILSARNATKLAEAKKEIQKEIKDAKLDSIKLDLGDKNSVKEFVEKFKSLNLELHFLILNAGVMTDEIVKTNDGFESQIGINHLGHHNLTMMLLPFMAKSKGEKRIVVLSSGLHKSGEKKILFEDFQMGKNYSGLSPRYAHSKLANVMFARELNKKLTNDNIDITVNSVHPGIIKTEFHFLMILTIKQIAQK
jgi:NAD(P)-dependent dehydrogenase (short-subunit alcohol dehydrogenase family)